MGCVEPVPNPLQFRRAWERACVAAYPVRLCLFERAGFHGGHLRHLVVSCESRRPGQERPERQLARMACIQAPARIHAHALSFSKTPLPSYPSSKFEFDYASRRKGVEKMIVVVMEPCCLDTKSWQGVAGGKLGVRASIAAPPSPLDKLGVCAGIAAPPTPRSPATAVAGQPVYRP